MYASLKITNERLNSGSVSFGQDLIDGYNNKIITGLRVITENNVFLEEYNSSELAQLIKKCWYFKPKDCFVSKRK